MDIFIAIAHAAETAHGTAATEGLEALGIDGKSFLFQLINFVILLFLLKRFAFPPILKMLEERRVRIEESLKMAEEIEKRNQQLKKEQAKLLKTAQAESVRILAESRDQSASLLKESETKARFRSEQLMSDAEASIKAEASTIRQDLRREAAKLIATATEHIIGEKIDDKRDAALIKSALLSVEKRENQ